MTDSPEPRATAPNTVKPRPAKELWPQRDPPGLPPTFAQTSGRGRYPPDAAAPLPAVAAPGAATALLAKPESGRHFSRNVKLRLVAVVACSMSVFHILSFRRPSFRGSIRAQREGAGAVAVPVVDPHADADAEEDFFYAPLLVNAGQGTTGTRFLHEVTCQMGLVSLHWGQACVPRGACPPPGRNASSSPRDFDAGYLDLLENQASLVRIHKKLLKSGKDTRAIRDRLLAHLEGVIAWGREHGVALMLHDSPYSLLMPDIARLVRRQYGAQARPIVLLTEREPHAWAASRIKNHPSDAVCRPPRATNAATPGMAPVNASTVAGGAFDIVGCIDRATAAHARVPPPMKKILYTVGNADRWGKRSYLVDALAAHQDAARGGAVFAVDLFAEDPRAEVAGMAARVARALRAALVRADGSTRVGEGGREFRGPGRFRALDAILAGTVREGADPAMNGTALAHTHVEGCIHSAMALAKTQNDA